MNILFHTEPEDLCKVVHITSVNLNKESNAVTHHTDKYDGVYDRVDESGEDLAGCLIVRRGQAFTVTLTFNRTFDKESDDIRLVFEIGKLYKVILHSISEINHIL